MSKKDPNESYKHYFAKQVVAKWLRELAQNASGNLVSWGKLKWFCPSSHGDYGVSVEEKRGKFFVDVLLRDGTGKCIAIEIINTSDVHQEKKDYILKNVGDLFKVDADWVLSQIGMPQNLVTIGDRLAKSKANESAIKQSRHRLQIPGNTKNLRDAELLGVVVGLPSIIDDVVDDLISAPVNDAIFVKCRDAILDWSEKGIGEEIGLRDYLKTCGHEAALETIEITPHFRALWKNQSYPDAMRRWGCALSSISSRRNGIEAKAALARAIESGDEDEIMRRMEMYNKSAYGNA